MNNKIDLELVLKALGADYKEQTNRFEFRSLLRDNKKRSVSLYKNSGCVIDFGGSFCGHISKLVKQVTGKTLNELLGLSGGSKLVLKPQKLKRGVRREIEINGILRPIEENKQVLDYCRSRMTDIFMKDFSIESYFRQAIINGKPYSDRLVIPIIKDRKTVSLELRDFTRDETKKKALYPVDSQVGFLFNLDSLRFDEPLVVVEGILDMSLIYTYVTKNVTTTFGVKLSPEQKRTLPRFKEVILFPDDDDGGEQFIENIRKILDYEFKIAKVKGKDPGASLLEEIKKALNNTQPLNEYLLDRYGFFDKKISLL